MADKQVKPEDEKESSIIEALRHFALGHDAPISSDYKDGQLAMDVDSSSGTAKGYAAGGIVSHFPAKRHDDGPTYQYADEGAKTEEDRVLHEEISPNMDHSIRRMADGGIVDPSDFTVGTDSSDTFKLNGQNPSLNMRTDPQPITDPLKSVGAPVATSPAKPGPSVTAPGNPGPAISTPGIPSGADLSAFSQYAEDQKDQIDKYGPKQQLATEAAINRARFGMPGALANAGAGFADALMQGVARAGNPGFQERMQQQGQNLEQEAVGNMARAHEENLQDIGEKQKLDAMDPRSALSQSVQKGFMPVLAKMGYKPAQLAGMSASQIGTIVDTALKYSDVQTQEALREAIARMGLIEQSEKAGLEVNPFNPFNWLSGGMDLRAKAMNAIGNQIPGSVPAHGIPDLGGTFNGQKVLKVTRVK